MSRSQPDCMTGVTCLTMSLPCKALSFLCRLVARCRFVVPASVFLLPPHSSVCNAAGIVLAVHMPSWRLFVLGRQP